MSEASSSSSITMSQLISNSSSLPPPPPPSSSSTSPLPPQSPLISSGNQKKERRNKKNKDKDKDGKVKKEKEERKLYTKLIVKRLPAMNYDLEKFEESLDNVCKQLDIERDIIQIDHFLKGKLSRKRGPVYGNGFIVIKDNIALDKFTDVYNKTIPFINDDISDQPNIVLSPYQKVFKTTKKNDDLIGTYETDPDYISFMERLNQPEVRRQPIESLDQIAKEPPVDMMKDVPLLAFLKQKAEKEMALRKSAWGKGNTIKLIGGKSGSSKSGSNSNFKKQKDKDRRKGKGKDGGGGGGGGGIGSAGGGGGGGEKKSKSEKFKEKKKEKRELAKLLGGNDSKPNEGKPNEGRQLPSANDKIPGDKQQRGPKSESFGGRGSGGRGGGGGGGGGRGSGRGGGGSGESGRVGDGARPEIRIMKRVEESK